MGFGFAFDSAGDPVYTVGADYLGLNGGSGMGAWYEGVWGSGSMAITTAGSAIGAQQFGLIGNGIDARRMLNDPLAIGHSLSFDMLVSNLTTTGRMGVEIRSTAANPNRDMLSINGNLGSSNFWRIEGGNDWSTFIVTSISVYSAVGVTISVTGEDSADVTIAELFGSGLETHSVNFVSEGVSPQIMNFFTWDDNNGEFYVNNIQAEVVPEPASMVALGVGALALIRRRKSRR